ncbi:DUF2478 domain-containing protein [Celeribacter neptunius]|uniref:Nucleoside-triphosphatase THEP1 n=1 Tax=Celeribacter neptunius TaxID=588602 RepID=A0A1I3QY92_9RHOB|nr:DUF2478 domain-containing protein [Celeribacter neptunius]SFJ38459.1 Nucleoside-triphosphatase THEP1 [Celeribacter neptunius]
MLGYVMMDGRGETDRLLEALAERLQAAGCHLAGAVQRNTERPGELRCRMELTLLPGAETVLISQDLGAHATGCRLDPDGLQRAVHQAEQALEQGAELVLINKFGKQELEGRGFRLLIGTALSEDVPVLLGVNPKNLDGFLEFAGEMAEALPPKPEALFDWCLRQMHKD